MRTAQLTLLAVTATALVLTLASCSAAQAPQNRDAPAGRTPSAAPSMAPSSSPSPAPVLLTTAAEVCAAYEAVLDERPDLYELSLRADAQRLRVEFEQYGHDYSALLAQIDHDEAASIIQRSSGAFSELASIDDSDPRWYELQESISVDRAELDGLCGIERASVVTMPGEIVPPAADDAAAFETCYSAYQLLTDVEDRLLSIEDLEDLPGVLGIYLDGAAEMQQISDRATRQEAAVETQVWADVLTALGTPLAGTAEERVAMYDEARNRITAYCAPFER